MTGKAAWTIIIAAVVVSMMGRPAAAESPECPCWDIAAVRRAVPTNDFPCQASPATVVQPGGLTMTAATTQSLESAQNFRLEAYLLEAQGQQQAACKCFSNPPIPGCVGSERKAIDALEGQACIQDITRLCQDLGKQ